MRRDCEPHRAPLLRLLGIVSLIGGVLAALGGLTAILAVPLGLTVWALARRDLARMEAGLMDPQGFEQTDAARYRGALAAFLGVGLGLLCGVVFSCTFPLAEMVLDAFRWPR